MQTSRLHKQNINLLRGSKNIIKSGIRKLALPLIPQKNFLLKIV